MTRFSLASFDRFAGLDSRSDIVLWLERTSFVFTVVLFAAAPHSIAASQTAWVLALISWLLSLVFRLFLGEKLEVNRTFLLIPILLFFFWSLLTLFLSYAPDISLGKIPSTLLFTAYFLVANTIRTRKALKLVTFTLVVSCMVNVIWTPLERIPGRGIEITGVDSDGPLAKAGAKEFDTLLKVNGKKLIEPAQLLQEIQTTGEGKIQYYRPDFYEYYTIRSDDLAKGIGPEEQLGFESWGRSRNWRSSGFYGMYATYSEVLVLIGSLVAGLLAAGLLSGLKRRNEIDIRTLFASLFLARNAALAICLVMIGVALLLTVTRASQASFLICGLLIAGLSFGRKVVLAVVLTFIPIAALGLYVLQQSRGVGFYDSKDNSITWRQTVYREGIQLWLANPRHFIFGVGMDSHKRFAPEWKLFDNGRLPTSHFHSNAIQLLADRGLPALLLFAFFTGLFLWKIWGAISTGCFSSWWEHGILLGGFAGMVGFQISGLVHYNFGDSEVVMVLYLLMALAVLTFQINRHGNGV